MLLLVLPYRRCDAMIYAAAVTGSVWRDVPRYRRCHAAMRYTAPIPRRFLRDMFCRDAVVAATISSAHTRWCRRHRSAQESRR
jgi:hypothetical protein